MAKLWLDHSDGRYSTRRLTDTEAAAHAAKGLDVVHLADSVYDSYLRHCDRDATWQALWCAISNEQAMRRREKELRPLEEAEQDYADYTCVFPQPGCRIEDLPPEWRERAAELLECYIPWAAGTVHQGCCCENSHCKLDEDAVRQLRARGFIVEQPS